MENPSFWNDGEKAREVIAEANQLKGWTEPWQRMSAKVNDLGEMLELLEMEPDPALAQDVEREVEAIGPALEELELKNMLQGPDDHRDALVTIHPGAGGTESQDWAQMLLRMFTRWGERKGFDVELLDLQEGEEAGIKDATLEIRGQYAYGFLKAERGVHRLVRISPFDSNARRHTSFAGVTVYPVVDDRIVIDIKESDVRTDTMRAQGAGGQHVNKTDSAVRLTHIPTNTVVLCQSERSQHKNRAQAWDMLRAKLYQQEVQRREEKAQADFAAKTDIGWGHQIRSYVLQPYQMVKDLRTGVQTSDTGGVLDGDLDEFMAATLAQRAFGTSPGAVEDVE
jgi:peptide chain release factor 2